MADAFAGFGHAHGHPVANYVLWLFLTGPAGLAHVSFPFMAGTPDFPALPSVVRPTAFDTALARRVGGRPARCLSGGPLVVSPVDGRRGLAPYAGSLRRRRCRVSSR